jgi:hypothetical protein
MARITFDDSGNGTQAQTSRSTRTSGRKRAKRGRSATGRATTTRASQPTRATARPASVPSITRAPLPGGDRSPWSGGVHTAGNPSPALKLTGGAGLLDVVLDLAGAEGGSVRGMLAAWQREQDRLANRAWRRPGGLVRPAGL